MKKILKKIDIKKEFNQLRSNFLKKHRKGVVVPLTMIGTFCDWDNYFLPWLLDECEKEKIDVSKSDPCGLDNAFTELRKKKNTRELTWFDDSKMLFLNKNQCFVGTTMDRIPEINSIKRAKIDVREDLEKINFLEKEDSPDMVILYEDVVILE
jgi:hypothetical protein